MFNNRQEEMKIISEVQEFFYNGIVLDILNDGLLTQSNFQVLSVVAAHGVIDNLLQGSARYPDAVVLHTGRKITSENCPRIYRDLFNALFKIKSIFGTREAERDIHQLAMTILNTSMVKEKIPFVMEFITSSRAVGPVAQTHAATVVQALPVHEPTAITAQQIRDSFYNEMKIQLDKAVTEGLMSRDDIGTPEAYIFLALPALTILETIKRSKHCNGILIPPNILLTKNNCEKTEGFDKLFEKIIAKKPAFSTLSSDELTLIKYMCLAKDAPLPAHLLRFKTETVTSCVGAINSAAYMITQRAYFKRMIGHIIGDYLSKPRETAGHSIARRAS